MYFPVFFLGDFIVCDSCKIAAPLFILSLSLLGLAVFFLAPTWHCSSCKYDTAWLLCLFRDDIRRVRSRNRSNTDNVECTTKERKQTTLPMGSDAQLAFQGDFFFFWGGNVLGNVFGRRPRGFVWGKFSGVNFSWEKTNAEFLLHARDNGTCTLTLRWHFLKLTLKIRSYLHLNRVSCPSSCQNWYKCAVACLTMKQPAKLNEKRTLRYASAGCSCNMKRQQSVITSFARPASAAAVLRPVSADRRTHPAV